MARQHRQGEVENSAAWAELSEEELTGLMQNAAAKEAAEDARIKAAADAAIKAAAEKAKRDGEPVSELTLDPAVN